MSFIRIVDEDDAEGPLARIYKSSLDPASQKVDHIIKVHSLDPPSMRGHLILYRSTMEDTEALPRWEKEMIAFTVSRLNQCHY